MKAFVAVYIQEKALVGAFSVITNLRMELFQALMTMHHDEDVGEGCCCAAPAEVDDWCGGREEDGEEARCVGGAGDHEERDPAAEPLHAEPRQQTAHQAADRQHARCNATTIHIYFLFTVQYCSLLFSSLELSNFDIDVLSNKHLNRALVCEYQCPY